MVDKARFEPKVIEFTGARLSFTHLHKAVARTGKDGKPKPGAKEKFSCEILLDPSNVEHQKQITEIKKEAFRALAFRFGEDKTQWPKNAGGADLYYCFGLGNDLPKLGRKIYDGYKDMFYVKLSDTARPSLRNRAGKVVVEGDPEVPYGGCYVNGKTTFYSYDNESKGVNANLRSLQFVKDGKGFGGGAQGAEDEYAALGDAPKTGAQAVDESDPFA
jgi:hypothetical protein